MRRNGAEEAYPNRERPRVRRGWCRRRRISKNVDLEDRSLRPRETAPFTRHKQQYRGRQVLFFFFPLISGQNFCWLLCFVRPPSFRLPLACGPTRFIYRPWHIGIRFSFSKHFVGAKPIFQRLNWKKKSKTESKETRKIVKISYFAQSNTRFR